MVVRQYLAQKFKVDDSRLKTLGIGEAPGQSPGGDVSIVVYPGGSDTRAIQARK